MKTTKIHYVTGTDGWGDEPATDEDRASFCALVEARLEARFPGCIATAEVDEDALESRVETNDPAIDRDELRVWIGNEVWEDWCSGARAAAVES